MRFDPMLAAIRFGCGLSPKVAPPADAGAMVEMLRGPDLMAQAFPIDGFETVHAAFQDIRRARIKISKAKTAEEEQQAIKERRMRLQALRSQAATWFRNTLLRRALTEDALRERLTFFWADHFTAIGKGGGLQYGFMPYSEEAIRPHVAGRFADMLKAVIVHPVMLTYLDQNHSTGPNSPAARTSERVLGLNENLAREVMELHTLGVDGPYGQNDVRELAELFTGLSYNARFGFQFRPRSGDR